MDWEGKVEAAKLVCAATAVPIGPGTTFHSALTFVDARFVRLDFSDQAWPSQDQGRFVSWWKQRAPEAGVPAHRKIDSDALMRIFADLKGATERHQQCFVYVISLFLMRAKKLRYLDTETRDGQSFLLVEDRVAQVVHRIRDPGMSADETEGVHKNLIEVIDLGLAAEVEAD